VQTERSNKIRRVMPSIIIVFGLLLIIASVIAYTQPWDNGASEEVIEGNITLIGVNHEQKVLSCDEIKALPYYEGDGGFFTTVGVMNGPYRVKGVPITDLCELVGGATPADVVFVSAEDGYSMVFSYEQIMGEFDTYDPETMRIVPHGEQKLVLAYEIDGKPFRREDGRPFRLALVGTDKLLVEGYNWVKWVVKIEVMPIKTAPNTAGTGL
jgi:DMSO/TMAO reductase YedYZ molybdopterin-dependent catalytic subunit